MSKEREKLAAEYRAAVAEYTRAVAAMHGLRDYEFEVARERAKQARLICEECRLALERATAETAPKKKTRKNAQARAV